MKTKCQKIFVFLFLWKILLEDNILQQTTQHKEHHVPETPRPRPYDRWGPSVLVGHAVCAAEVFKEEVQLVLRRLVGQLVESLLGGRGRLQGGRGKTIQRVRKWAVISVFNSQDSADVWTERGLAIKQLWGISALQVRRTLQQRWLQANLSSQVIRQLRTEKSSESACWKWFNLVKKKQKPGDN